jgi:hypothetical protein
MLLKLMKADRAVAAAATENIRAPTRDDPSRATATSSSNNPSTSSHTMLEPPDAEPNPAVILTVIISALKSLQNLKGQLRKKNPLELCIEVLCTIGRVQKEQDWEQLVRADVEQLKGLFQHGDQQKYLRLVSISDKQNALDISDATLLSKSLGLQKTFVPSSSQSVQY